MKGQRFLVTGGAGFIGSWLCERLLEQGNEVVALDNLSTGSIANVPAGAEMVLLDLVADDLDTVFGRFRPQVVIHCAARVSVVGSMEGPEQDLRDNLSATLRLLKTCAVHNVEKIAYLSSGAAIYGERDTPADEDAPVQPASFYGVNKYAAERYCAIGGLPWLSLRPSNVYGPRQRPDTEAGVVAIFVDRLRRGEPVDVFGDGTQVRDYIYVSDVVSAIIAALEGGLTGVYNVSSGCEYSINELVQLLGELTGKVVQVNRRPGRPGEIIRSRLSSRRLQSAVRWHPQVGFREGLRRCLDHFSLAVGKDQ